MENVYLLWEIVFLRRLYDKAAQRYECERQSSMTIFFYKELAISSVLYVSPEKRESERENCTFCILYSTRIIIRMRSKICRS